MLSSQELCIEVAQLTTRVTLQKTEDNELLTTEIFGVGLLRYPYVQVLHEGYPDKTAKLTQCEVRIQVVADREEDHVECFMFNYLESYGQFPKDVRMTVSVLVSKSLFEALRASLIISHSRCNLYLELSDWVNKFTVERDFANVRAKAATLHLESSQHFVKVVPQNYEDSSYYQAVAEKVLSKRWALRYRIGVELSSGLALQDLSATRWNVIETLDEIMSYLVSSFHSMEENTVERIPQNLFRLSPTEFLEQVSDLPKSLSDKLISSYDRVWIHVPIMQVLRTGEAASELNAQRLSPNVEEIEELARLYYEHKQLCSPLLEWAIINALIYSETINFARTILAKNHLLGFPIAESIEPVGYWKQLRLSLTEGLGSIFCEAYSLGLTAIAASVANFISESGFWLLFWGITAIRWIRKRDDPKLEVHKKNYALLSDMISAHQCLKTYDFNADLLKARLHALEIRGAVFSVTVYNLLEKRLYRD
ncbi:hypothetical protein H8L32_13400 [Undibacterium sp. CY18W]|uniref:Uncharacterized protein n=1 Tax=Undibacterium hunanense TaxID=2762292 RepID=A0ABR6ZRJ3_9BURK|nr:hypothetical protein [Undibacterium hunanense]MBC3918482.1 hypothetical protein [Undibacterium hunanense]